MKNSMIVNALLTAVTGAALIGLGGVAQAAPIKVKQYCDYPLTTNPHLPETKDCSDGRYTS